MEDYCWGTYDGDDSFITFISQTTQGLIQVQLFKYKNQRIFWNTTCDKESSRVTRALEYSREF